jgi:hypothetical protein
MEGIHKHGIGKWAAILKDESLAFCRNGGRTAVDLKDKYRNLRRIGIKGAGKVTLLNNDHQSSNSSDRHPTSRPSEPDGDAIVDVANSDGQLNCQLRDVAGRMAWVRFRDMSRDTRHQRLKTYIKRLEGKLKRARIALRSSNTTIEHRGNQQQELNVQINDQLPMEVGARDTNRGIHP